MNNYSNYMGYQQPLTYQQPIYQPPTTQQNRTNIEVIFATEKEAEAFIVPVGKKVLFVFNDKPMIMFKSTDMMGYSNIERYKTQKVENLSTETQTNEFNPEIFVKQEDFNNRFAEMSKQVEELNNKMKMITFIDKEKNNG